MDFVVHGKNKQTMQRDFEDALQLLRNACIVSGMETCLATNAFRQTSTDKAFHLLCTSIVPDLVESNVLTATTKLKNIIDVGALHQKACIQRP